jgi:hypothetical protein
MKLLKRTPTEMIRRLFFEGKNSIQIFLLVKDQFPNYEDRKLRKLISVVKVKQLKK